MAAKPHIIVLGCNFAGLTTARYIREFAGDKVSMTCIDQKPYLSFIPNIPIEVWNNNNPARELHMPFIKFLDRDDIRFIQGKVNEIDVENRRVYFMPAERSGSPSEKIQYDYLVIALGNHLAFDKIKGFADYGHTFTDTFYGDEIRRYLHEGGYRGGPIVIGSDLFLQGKSEKLPSDLPIAGAACEGPPVEVAFSLADWLKKRDMGGAEKITLFTPAEVIAEDAGEEILNKLLPMMQNMGYGYKADTKGILEINEDGIVFKDGSSLEAELKIIFPNWEAHSFLKELPISDDQGFIVTDMYMRNPDYPEVFAVGDAASITVPKLGSLGHLEAEVLARVIGKDIGTYNPEGEIDPMQFMLICMGDMGGQRGFYMHTNEWWGGDISILKMGYTPHMLKMGFKSMYYTLGGKIPSWGLPVSEFLADHTVI